MTAFRRRWTILAELGQLSQPGFYGEHNTANLQKTATRVAAEKAAVGHGVGSNRIIPWLTTETLTIGETFILLALSLHHY